MREKGSGKFENTRVIQLTYKSRCYWRHAAKMETDRERLLLCYQVNLQVVQGKFPLNRELAFELAALMAQVIKMLFSVFLILLILIFLIVNKI